jgi:hypothetical protein
MNQDTSRIVGALGKHALLIVLFLFSVGLMKVGAWASWFICIGLIVLVVVPVSRYPQLTQKRKWIIGSISLVSMLLAIPFQWK